MSAFDLGLVDGAFITLGIQSLIYMIVGHFRRQSSQAAQTIARAGALAKYRPSRGALSLEPRSPALSPGPEASRKKRVSGHQFDSPAEPTK